MALDARKHIDKICNIQCHAKFQLVTELMLVPKTINDFCKPLDIYGINGNLDGMNYGFFFLRMY